MLPPLITGWRGRRALFRMRQWFEVSGGIPRLAVNLFPLRQATSGLLITCCNYSPNSTRGMLMDALEGGAACSQCLHPTVPKRQGYNLAGVMVHRNENVI